MASDRRRSTGVPSAPSSKVPDVLTTPVKLAVPTVSNGHVYVGTQPKLDVYGVWP